MRPKSIVAFEWFFFASLALGLIDTLMSSDTQLGMLETSETGMGIGFMAAIVAASVGISLLFWHFIVHRASSTSKWIYTVLSAVGVLGAPMTIAITWSLDPFAAVMNGFANLTSLASIVCLFRSDAKEWFATKGNMTSNPSIFA